jgi:hypothetical protein
MEPRSGSNRVKKQRVNVRSRSQPRQDTAGRVFSQVWNRTEPNRWPKLGPVANTIQNAKPVEPVSFYPCMKHPELITI